jgi:hypothetical protein
MSTKAQPTVWPGEYAAPSVWERLAAYEAVAEAAQEWGRFACYKIPEKVALTNREWAEAECGECPSCRLNAAIERLLPQDHREGE